MEAPLAIMATQAAVNTPGHTSSWPESESDTSSLDNFYKGLPGAIVPVKDDL